VTKIPNRVSIHDRPKDVERKSVFGHWEGDLMSFMKNSQHMLVLHERKSLYVKSCVLENKQASTTKKALIELMKCISGNARKTLTLDNGGEFAEHEGYKEIGLNAYFCDPYSSWQKGGVENSNGRLRVVLPRSTDIKNIGLDKFNKIIDNYNSTPRKSLGWMTPEQVFEQNLCA
jgi:transposase, IS30 family